MNIFLVQFCPCSVQYRYYRATVEQRRVSRSPLKVCLAKQTVCPLEARPPTLPARISRSNPVNRHEATTRISSLVLSLNPHERSPPLRPPSA
ncbi:hypothetical protein PoB_006631300 [Plakobranchus ocellatus]|uniref:Uncharacterized protein n=1 Tax=Plakobranchus ocellatus TaxID=259542 RepID=A0AAV4D6F6_9GAST|nr:hypothetical protein PoB_006631300 [Plakobranchus ocellatus]